MLPTTVRQPRRPAPRKRPPAGVHVEGLDDVMVRLSRCCTPVPGDEILGFVTRGRGRVGAPGRLRQRRVAGRRARRDRLIDVEWDEAHDGTFVAAIEVKALDRGRLLRDVAASLSDHHVNILSSTTHTGSDRVSKMRFEFELGRPRPPRLAPRPPCGASTASTTPTGWCPAKAGRARRPPRAAG